MPMKGTGSLGRNRTDTARSSCDNSNPHAAQVGPLRGIFKVLQSHLDALLLDDFFAVHWAKPTMKYLVTDVPDTDC